MIYRAWLARGKSPLYWRVLELTSFLSAGIGGMVFLEAFNAICWGAIVRAIGSYKMITAISPTLEVLSCADG
jgi:hypothetical protein